MFAESEVINHLASGRSAEDICAGAIVALAGRAGQLAKRVKPEPEFALTGGLTRVPLMKRELEQLLGCEFLLGEDELGVYAGGIGAAILAQQRLRKLGEGGESHNSFDNVPGKRGRRERGRPHAERP